MAFSITERFPFSRDFKRKAQLEDAIDSVCRNIAEGFGCRSHVEFARFLEISRRSLNEFRDALHSAMLKRYVTEKELEPISVLIRRTHRALSKLIAYLRRTSAN